MANAKISDDLVFIPEISDVRDIGGLAGFTGSANAKISGAFLAQSVVNESGSGIGTNDGSGNINSRVAFYGVGNPSNTLAGAEGFQYYSANSGNSTEASLQLGVAGGNQYDVGNLILKGNYIGGSTSAKIEFRSNDTVDPNAFKSFIIKGSDAASDDQTWILPRTLPTAGQILKANTVSSQDVGLSWTDAASGGGGGIVTLTTGAATGIATWDYDDGASAIWTPTVTLPPNALAMTNFPGGSIGALKIDPTLTADFTLPANSKADSGSITISNVNPSILYYFYDGTTFYWFTKVNMIDPIYLPPVSKSNLIALWAPSSYEGAVGDVDNGSAWPNSYTQNNLLGDLTAVNTDTSGLHDIRFTARNDATSTPANFFLGEDGSNSASYFNIASNLGGNVAITSWTGAMWFQVVSGTSTGFNGLMDPDKDDDDAIYIYNKRIYIEGPNIYSNFPAFSLSGETGNDNPFSLEDEWIYVSVAFNVDTVTPANSTITFAIGCQATLDEAGGSILGYDGNDIDIESSGLYIEEQTVNLSSDTWNDFSYGAAVSSFGTVYSFEGKIGLGAVYGTAISNTVAETNWDATKEFYYIT